MIGKRCFLGGAQAAGRESGALEQGLWADMMALDGDATDFIGRSGDNLLDTWIFAGTDARISDVWAAGRLLVKDGQHIERENILSNYRATLTRLQDVM